MQAVRFIEQLLNLDRDFNTFGDAAGQGAGIGGSGDAGSFCQVGIYLPEAP